MINHCEAMKDRVAILDAPPDMNAAGRSASGGMNVAGYDSQVRRAVLPLGRIANPVADGNGRSACSCRPPATWPASGPAPTASAASTRRPANEVVRGAIGLEMQISRNEQDTLNPIGINCIRAFPGRGIRVWGARTLSSDPSWRYINVRRLFNFVEKSIENGTQWVVFEPNDCDLWERVTRDVSAFLTRVWRDGALFGATPDEAFYVKCDAELNPPEVRDAGQLIVEIGIAPVKPAEFVIFRISQYSPVSGLIGRVNEVRQTMPIGLKTDPGANFHFYVDIESVFQGTFREVSGLGSENPVIEHWAARQERARPSTSSSPGAIKCNDITFKRGLTRRHEAAQVAREGGAGKVDRGPHQRHHLDVRPGEHAAGQVELPQRLAVQAHRARPERQRQRHGGRGDDHRRREDLARDVAGRARRTPGPLRTGRQRP